MNGVRYSFRYAGVGFRPILSLTEGNSQIMANINRELKKIREVSQERLRRAAHLILETAKVLCPKDTLALVESAYIEIFQTATGMVAEIGFARPNAPAFVAGRKPPGAYAVYVHENMEVYHPIGQAKFLEEAIKRREREVLAILKGEM